MRTIAKPVLVLGTLLAAIFLATFAAGTASATTNTPASAVSTASSATAASAPAATPQGGVSAQGFVSIPSNYVYNPNLGSLHDYCTSSPDKWFSADFRGPCARHDLCYQAHTAGKAACDSGLHNNLISNCNYFYPSGSSSCLAAADVYYAAVVAFGGYKTVAPQAGKQVPERVGASGITAAPELR